MPGQSGATSNADDFGAIFAEIEGLLDFDVGDFGSDLIDIVAEGIVDRTLGRQKSPDDSDLAANRGRYGKRKRAKAIPVGTGLDDASPRMLDLDEVRGDVDIRPDSATMTMAGFSADKAGWFEEGKKPRTKKGRDSTGRFTKAVTISEGQPPRPFYGLDDEIEAKLDERVDRQLDERLRDLAR